MKKQDWHVPHPEGDWRKRLEDARDAGSPREQAVLLARIFEDLCNHYKKAYQRISSEIQYNKKMDLLIKKISDIEATLEGSRLKETPGGSI